MKNTALPSAIARDEYAALRRDERRWMPSMAEIACAHGLDGAEIRPVAAGSNLIAELGEDLVIKLFPPFLRYQFQSERLALRLLHGRVRTATPAIVFEGDLADWPYLVITRLEGVLLGTIWASCSEVEKCQILRSIGELIAEVQSIPPGALAELEPHWNDFIARQVEQCRSRHERLGLARHLAADIARYLARTADALPDSFQSVVLTGEYTPDNLLMTREHGAWRISGLIDFGDAMVGFGEYDLLGPSTFLATGDEVRVRQLLSGFGFANSTLDSGLSRRLMRMLLLHRHSDLRLQVSIEHWEDRVQNLDELERLLWPIGGSS